MTPDSTTTDDAERDALARETALCQFGEHAAEILKGLPEHSPLKRQAYAQADHLIAAGYRRSTGATEAALREAAEAIIAPWRENGLLGKLREGVDAYERSGGVIGSRGTACAVGPCLSYRALVNLDAALASAQPSGETET